MIDIYGALWVVAMFSSLVLAITTTICVYFFSDNYNGRVFEVTYKKTMTVWAVILTVGLYLLVNKLYKNLFTYAFN